MQRRATPNEIIASMDSLRGLALALVRDSCAADDAVQEAVLRALISPPRSGPTTRAWLATVLRNTVRKTWRKESRREARELRDMQREAPAEPLAQMVRTEQLGALVDALRSLAPEKREAVELRYLQGLPPAEIAKRLDCPVGTVKTRLKRGMAELRATLDDERGRSWSIHLATALALKPADSGAAGSEVALAGSWVAGTWLVVGLVLVLVCALLGLGLLAQSVDRTEGDDARLAGQDVAAAQLGDTGRLPVPEVDERDPGTSASDARGTGASLIGRASPGAPPARPESNERLFKGVRRPDVERHISRLAGLDDYGVMARFMPEPRLTGSASAKNSSGAAAALELIRLGPEAVPSLLAALEDDRKTKINLPRGRGFGTAVLSKVSGDLKGTSREEYTARIGDVCYMILGQIVGRRELHFVGWDRSKERIRTGPSMIIKSPLLNRERRERLRKQFKDGESPEDVVFQMLMDRFDAGSRHLAPRLLHYFPDRSVDAITESLRSKRGDGNFHFFVGYLAVFDIDAVQTELLDVFLSTRNTMVMDACLTPRLLAIHRPAVRASLGERLAAPPREQTLWQFSSQQKLLKKAVDMFPEHAEELLTTYGNLELYQCRTAALVEMGNLKRPAPWVIPCLARFLEDRRPGWRGYKVKRVRHSMRVCDVAAVALAKHLPDAGFSLNGGHDALDVQIARLAELASEYAGR